LVAAIALGATAAAPGLVHAGIVCHTIPREVAAVDVNTGGPYMAPPVPYGCYAKDPLGTIAEACGLVRGCLSSICGLAHGCCANCHGKGCDQCGGTGNCGHCDKCAGAGAGSGSGHHWGGHCGLCGGGDPGCGFCGWRGLLHGHGKNGCLPASGCGGGSSICSAQQVNRCGFSGHASTVCASVQAPAPLVSAQSPCASGQSICNQAGCLLKMRHFHRMGRGCSACGGAGCGFCKAGGMASGTVCGGCGGAGCGQCGGLGFLHHGKGKPCSACGGKGCALCHGTGLCNGLCSSLLGVPAGLAAKLLHIGEIEYFIGPGGPVPLTPGYVPYVVTTRSPRDYFAFPPFSDLDP
jgi:hypothetical protein